MCPYVESIVIGIITAVNATISTLMPSRPSPYLTAMSVPGSVNHAAVQTPCSAALDPSKPR